MAKRSYGTGQLYEKHGAYYGRWRGPGGRKLNRRIGRVRAPGSSEGLTRSQAERAFGRVQQEEEGRVPVAPHRSATVTEAADSLRRKLALEGARKSYLVGCRSMQRVQIDPRLGTRALTDVSTADVEAMASAMLAAGLKPASVRNVLSSCTLPLSTHSSSVGRATTPFAGLPDRGADGRRRRTPICSS